MHKEIAFFLISGQTEERSIAELLLRRAVLSCLLFALSLVPLSGETFRNPRHIPIPSNPTVLGTADFNGDGIPDFYYPVNGQLNILLGQSSGSYANAPSVSLGAETGGCRAYDLNGDTFLDLVCVTPASAANSFVTVSLGNGDGTFKPPISTTIPGSGSFSRGLIPLAAHDLNGDGHTDLVLLDSEGNQLYTLLGDGSGNFPSMKVLAISVGPFISTTAVLADINGDGHLDLLLGNYLITFLGQPDGSFTLNGHYGFNNCAFADFDKDGHLDVACASIPTTAGLYSLVILHGNTDGTFNTTPLLSIPFTQADFTGVIAIDDLNGDGIPDILAQSGEGLVVFLGQPGLQFSQPTHYSFFNSGPFNGDQDDASLIADFNKDGNLDLATLGANGIYITYGRNDGTFDAQPLVESGTSIGFAVVGDYNSDGIPDVATSGSTSLQLNLGKGDGTFSPSAATQTGNLPSLAPGTNALLMTGDFNGDGHPDLIATNQTADNPNSAHILFGNGDGTFGSPTLATSTAGNVPVNSLLTPTTVADINQDGKQDLINVSAPLSANSSVNVFLSNGDGSFRVVSTPVPQGTFSYYQSPPAAADFNGDGKIDLIVPSNTTIEVLLGHGDGTFDVSATALAVPPITGPSGYIPAVVAGDFDRDGKMDFAVIATSAFRGDDEDSGPTSIFIYYGNGDGTFATPVTAATLDHGYLNLATADLNGDGLADFVLSTNSAGGIDFDNAGDAIAVIHSLPGHTFSGETNLIAGSGLSSLAIADFNRDGLPDLLFANGIYGGQTSTRSFAVLLSQGTTSIALTSSSTSSTYGQSISLTAMISTPPDLNQIPSAPGTVTLNGLPGGPVSLPVTFSSSGAPNPTITGTAVYPTSSLPAGTYNLSASFSGSSDLLSSSSSTLTQVVDPAPTSTILTASTGSPILGQMITFTAKVNGTAGAPSGTVQFLDGTTSLGTIALSSGVASFTTSTLGGGNHSIAAVYSGDSNFAPSTSSAINFTIPQPSYQISVQSSTLTLKAGATTGNTNLVSVVPLNGFTGTVTLACTVAYTGSGTASFTPTCSLAPAAVQIAGGTATSTLSILTTLPHLTRARNSAPVGPPHFKLGSGILLALLLCTVRSRVRFSWKILSAILVATSCLMVLVGCSGKSPAPVSTTPGTYSITISATSNTTVVNPNPAVVSLTVN